MEGCKKKSYASCSIDGNSVATVEDFFLQSTIMASPK